VGTLSRYPPLLLAVTLFALGFIIFWLYLTPPPFSCHSLWKHCLIVFTSSQLSLLSYKLITQRSLFLSAESLPSRLILLSCVYVHCRWLVCHRHVITARIPSPQCVLWSAAYSQLSTWYFDLSPIFVSFLCYANLLISNCSYCIWTCQYCKKPATTFVN